MTYTLVELNFLYNLPPTSTFCPQIRCQFPQGLVSYYLTYVYVSVCVYAQSHSTLCNPMDCSRPGSSVHGIFQARILEWVAISHYRESSQLRDLTCITCVSCFGQ